MFGKKWSASGTCGTCRKYKLHVIWAKEALVKREQDRKKDKFKNNGQKLTKCMEDILLYKPEAK